MYKKANFEGMREDINKINWEETLKCEENSMEDIINIFNGKFNEIMDKHIPTTVIDHSKGMRPPLDQTMRNLIQEKDKATSNRKYENEQ